MNSTQKLVAVKQKLVACHIKKISLAHLDWPAMIQTLILVWNNWTVNIELWESFQKLTTKHANRLDGIKVSLRWANTETEVLSLSSLGACVSTRHVGRESLDDSRLHKRAPNDRGHSLFIRSTVFGINSGYRCIGTTL